jgi:hypothetical protein
MERLHQFGRPRILLGLLGRLRLHRLQDGFLGPSLLGILYAGKELEQSQTGRAPHRVADGSEIEGVGDGERAVEVEEHRRDPE